LAVQKTSEKTGELVFWVTNPMLLWYYIHRLFEEKPYENRSIGFDKTNGIDTGFLSRRQFHGIFEYRRGFDQVGRFFGKKHRGGIPKL
jgi:hypothetical protein